VIDALAGLRGLHLISLGGQYNRCFHGFFGLMAEQTMGTLRANHLFMSTSSVQGRTSFHQDQEVTKTKRAMIASAERRFLLVDHGKFQKTALNVLADLSVFDCVITGEGLAAEARCALDEANVPVRVVSFQDPAARGAGAR
jgi:DeoR/GlpR family transcriptional regulator of sugar metabolism